VQQRQSPREEMEMGDVADTDFQDHYDVEEESETVGLINEITRNANISLMKKTPKKNC
jgi:hypothetical protein